MGSDKSSSAVDRFLSSMTMTFDMWHDGQGYDLDALAECAPDELERIETTLASRAPLDWRDVEALARIDSPRARAAVEAALKDPDPKVRREALRHAADKSDPTDRQALLLKALRTAKPFGGLTEALEEVERFHPPAAIDELFRGALRSDAEVAVHYAAMLFYLHGRATEPFDWSHRPFFLEFHAPLGGERRKVFARLCEALGTDPRNYE